MTGSIKFDIQLDEQVQTKGRALRQLLGRSTGLDRCQHPSGEDEQVLAAFDRVLAAQPSALLILVPRHPERFERVAALCAPTAACGARRAVWWASATRFTSAIPWASCR